MTNPLPPLSCFRDNEFHFHAILSRLRHAVVQRCIALGADPVMVPAGKRGKFSLLYKAFHDDLLEMARISEHGRTLTRLGFEEDLSFCVRTNVSSLVPVFRDGSIILD